MFSASSSLAFPATAIGFDRGTEAPVSCCLGVLAGAGPGAEYGGMDVLSRWPERKRDGVRFEKALGVLLMALETALMYFLPAL